MRVYVGGGRVFVFPSGLFLFEGSVRRILPVFFFMSFRSGAFLAKKVTGRLYL